MKKKKVKRVKKVKREFIKPFRTGDKVRYVGGLERESDWRVGEMHIIYECHVHGLNSYEYSTNRGAWIDHEEFVLVEECSEKNIMTLYRSLQEELKNEFD